MDDSERNRLMHEFYQMYAPLRKRYNLRMHSHFDVYGKNFIEIWEYKGDIRGKRICLEKGEDEAECYKRAIEELKNYKRNRECGFENLCHPYFRCFTKEKLSAIGKNFCLENQQITIFDYLKNE